MTNNDILRRVRYILNDTKMMNIFSLAELEATREQISDWLKKDDDPNFKPLNDMQMATFLNGLIESKRGKKEGEKPPIEKRLTNNIVFMKLKIAFNLQADDVLELMSLADFKISKHELSAFFRKKDHKHYRECKDQILRNFLQGLQIKFRDAHQ